MILAPYSTSSDENKQEGRRSVGSDPRKLLVTNWLGVVVESSESEQWCQSTHVAKQRMEKAQEQGNGFGLGVT